MTRILEVCADDFGIAPGVSAGIVRLARGRRLTAISCITNSPGWERDASLLDDLPDTIELGLHLNFTEGAPLSTRLAKHWPAMPSLPKLIALAHLGRLPRPLMRNEVHAQLAAFNRVLGRPPDFIDGHQHVHALPGLREIILDMVEHVQPLPAVRNTGRVLGPGFGFKRWVIERTGGRALGEALRQRVFPHNAALLGVYDFSDRISYRERMQGWLAALPPEGALLFCHPGNAPSADESNDEPDAIIAARVRELAYLASAEFAADLISANVDLGSVWRTLNEKSRDD